jgi:subtilisin family serine protease
MSSVVMPFPGATGKGIKIAVIDSGVNTKHPHIVSKTLSIVDGEEDNVTGQDMLGHGTAVAAAIQEKAPGAEYFAVKVFHKSLSTTSARLLQAIEWAVDHNVNLINLSLGTTNSDSRPALEALVKRAESRGVILVCARSENESPVLPGILPGVLSVDVDWALGRHSYCSMPAEDDYYYLASGFPRPLPGLPPVRNLSGISFAVANMTGLAARACEQFACRSIRDLQRCLNLANS